MSLFATNASADISPCTRYRYSLTRCWEPAKPSCGWIMLNPSRADAATDDPTIRKCIKFSYRWGYGGIVVANLFALRATDPDELLLNGMDLVGNGVDSTYQLVFACPRIVAAWGSHKIVERTERHLTIRSLARTHKKIVECLAINSDGQPRHPLYVRNDTQPIVWFNPFDQPAGGAV